MCSINCLTISLAYIYPLLTLSHSSFTFIHSFFHSWYLNQYPIPLRAIERSPKYPTEREKYIWLRQGVTHCWGEGKRQEFINMTFQQARWKPCLLSVRLSYLPSLNIPLSLLPFNLFTQPPVPKPLIPMRSIYLHIYIPH